MFCEGKATIYITVYIADINVSVSVYIHVLYICTVSVKAKLQYS